MVVRALLFVVGLGSLLGCSIAGAEFCPPDGGAGADGGLCEPPPPDDSRGADAGPDLDHNPVGEVEPPECAALIEKVCGTGEPRACAEQPGCVAATLVREHVPSDCAAALENSVSYPTCRPGPCVLLVDRVCGGSSDDAACRDAPGCEPARVLEGRSRSSDADERAEAEASCNAALEDDVVFAACS